MTDPQYCLRHAPGGVLDYADALVGRKDHPILSQIRDLQKAQANHQEKTRSECESTKRRRSPGENHKGRDQDAEPDDGTRPQPGKPQESSHSSDASREIPTVGPQLGHSIHQGAAELADGEDLAGMVAPVAAGLQGT